MRSVAILAAGLATLEQLECDGFYDTLAMRTRSLIDGLRSAADDAGIPLAVEALGGMFGFVFTDDAPVRSYEQVAAADIDRFRRFFHGMLERDVYLAPSAFEAGFVSAAHGEQEIARTLDAASAVFATLAS